MTMINTIQANWNEFVAAVQKQYTHVTVDDLDSVKGNIKDMVDMIQRKTGQARHEVEAFVASVTANTADAFQQASNKAGEYIHRAGDGVRDAYQYSIDASNDGYQNARKSVRKRPVEAVAIAFGVGIVAGLIAACTIHRKNNHHS